jgi:hypothetical protein
VQRLLKLQAIEDEELSPSAAGAEAASTSEAADSRPAWMRLLEANAEKWLSLVPAACQPLKVPSSAATGSAAPLIRCLEREVGLATGLVAKVRTDLKQMICACRGEIKHTNYLRGLMRDLSKGMIGFVDCKVLTSQQGSCRKVGASMQSQIPSVLTGG